MKSALRVKVSVSGVDESIRSILRLVDPAQRVKAIAAGAAAAVDAVKGYYSSRGRNMWVNPSSPTQGAGRKPTQWWRGTATGWSVISSNQSSAVLSNSTIGLAHKVSGGTIRAKRKSFLTIPLIPEAHGLTARGYSRTIAPLFRVKNALMQATEDGGMKAVFALKKSVTQAPWPGALPAEQTYLEPFAKDALDTLIADFEKNT